MINEQELRNRITKNLIYYRKKAGMTQMEVANLLSYSDKAISKWERGLGLPDITVLAQLADLYGVTISELCESDHDGEKPIKEVDDETQKIIEKRHQLITYISVGLLWLTSTILFFIFKTYFNPKIIGKENIPKEGFLFKKKKKQKTSREFPGSPVVKALPSNAGGAGLIPGRGAKHMPQGQKTKT